MQAIRILSFVFALFLFPCAGYASDHADPFKIGPDEQAANITGLFFFPEGGQMIYHQYGYPQQGNV